MAYFPNSTAGEVLDIQCGDCKLPNDAPCPILLVQANYNYDQLKDGNERLREAMSCLINDEGKCLMKPLIDEI